MQNKIETRIKTNEEKLEKNMEQYKIDFINFLLQSNALKIGGDFNLKSKRVSPYFVNTGDFNSGDAIRKLGEAYAATIENEKLDADVLFGPAYKGISLAVSTAIALDYRGKKIGFAFDRKEAKTHGEVRHGEVSQGDLQKAHIVGTTIKDNGKIVILDDVFTTGNTKYECLDLLNSLAANLKFSGLIIAVDRQEVGVNGENAILEFTKKSGIPVYSIVNSSEICEYLKDKSLVDRKDLDRVEKYLRVYGNENARKQNLFEIGKMKNNLEQKIIDRDRSIIVACDVSSIEEFGKLVSETCDVDCIGGYKVGFELGLGYGLPAVVNAAREFTNKPLIYDHQKAGTDIPDTGKNFATVCKKSGIDTVIFFPQAGPETERTWIYHALDAELKVIVGGRMTHPAYAVSEGGFISDEGALEMYKIAARAGINDFVVPGNKVDVIENVKKIVLAEGADPVFYAPGFISQGGKIEDAARAVGNKWHAIVGRAITQAKNYRDAALVYSGKL